MHFDGTFMINFQFTLIHIFDVAELLDFETQSIYDLRISVSDGGGTPAVITFTIDVTNVNEYTPVFTNTGILFI